MTLKLYLKDAYLKEFGAKVAKVEGNRLVLDQTAFYPTSGGQPCDTGTVSVNGTEYAITDVRKEGDDVVHIAGLEVKASPGDDATGSIDWERRYAHMRYHTALHVVGGVIADMHGSSGFATGSQIYEDRARIDMDMPELNRELLEKIIAEANSVVDSKRAIIVRELTREEALGMENLVRTEPGRKLVESLTVVRVIEIAGLDVQMDAGTHVKDTGEVGRITLSKFENKGAHSKRVEITLS